MNGKKKKNTEVEYTKTHAIKQIRDINRSITDMWVIQFEHFHVLIKCFITAQTAFCHCTFSIYHSTFCASLRIKKCPA